MNKLNYALSLTVFKELKLIPLQGYTKTPSTKNWNSNHTIPFPTLKPLLEKNNYGVVCGKVSRGLWVIDCDTPSKVREIDALLEKHHLKTYQVSTKRGRHFYFKSPLFLYSASALDIDIKGQGSYVVGAGSINGSVTYSPYNNEEILVVYPKGKHQELFQDLETIVGKKIKLRPYLSSQLKERLNNLGKEQSTSEQEFNIILEMVSKGYSQQEISQFLKSYLNPKSHLFKMKDQKKYLEYSYKKAFQICHYKKNQEKNNVIDQYIGFQSLKATTKKILWYLYKQGEGKGSVKASYRQIMKNASIGSLKTVQKHINILIQLEYIQKTETSIYKLNSVKIIKNETIPNTIVLRTSSLNIDAVLRKNMIHPIFSHGYLGANSFFVLQSVFRCFLFSHFSFQELSSFLSIPSSSIYRVLKMLVSLNVLIKSSKSYSLSKDFFSILEEYALYHQIEKKYQKKIEKIKQQQQAYQFNQILFRSYKKGHMTETVWKKIQFTLLLFEIDASLILQLLEEELVLKAVS